MLGGAGPFPRRIVADARDKQQTAYGQQELSAQLRYLESSHCSHYDASFSHEAVKYGSLRTALLVFAGIMAGVVAARMLAGPFRFGPVSVTAPLNPEGLLGLSLALLLLTRTGPLPADAGWTRRRAALLAMSVAAFSILAVRGALGLYFLSDDFILAKIGNSFNSEALRYTIRHGGGDGFFRPLGYLSLSLDAALGGYNPRMWHAVALSLHAINAALVVFVARRLGASIFAAGFAGALFAAHGVHPEAVAWIAGRFDLLATFFLLAGLLFLFSAKTFPALSCFALAALSKESAYVFPLLVAAYAVWKRQPLRRTIPYFALAAILFAYRWVLFGGIGGYVDRATGRPLALSLGFGSTLKAVGVRVWASLFFPLNWSRNPPLPLALLAIVYLAALLWLGLRTRGSAACRLALAALLISLLPVLSLLAGSPTLSGSRVLYLPSVWFAILIAVAIDGIPPRARYTIAAITLAFQFAALQHNLRFWEAASQRVEAACATGAPAVPDWIDGVPALANGRQECVEISRPAPP